MDERSLAGSILGKRSWNKRKKTQGSEYFKNIRKIGAKKRGEKIKKEPTDSPTPEL